MKLNDTCSLMNSADYKERFLAEYHQLKIRLDKLRRFIAKIDAAKLWPDVDTPQHDSPDNLLIEQLQLMERYLRVLEMRAHIEGVELG